LNYPKINSDWAATPEGMMTYGRKESFLGAWSQLGGPWCRLGGPWSRLGGPWSRLGGPLSRLGGPRSREKISLISEAVRRPREADYEIFKRARATHTSSFKSHKYTVELRYKGPGRKGIPSLREII